MNTTGRGIEKNKWHDQDKTTRPTPGRWKRGRDDLWGPGAQKGQDHKKPWLIPGKRPVAEEPPCREIGARGRKKRPERSANSPMLVDPARTKGVICHLPRMGRKRNRPQWRIKNRGIRSYAW